MLPCPLRGVFCNSAIKAAESDHEMVVQTLVQTRQELKDLVSILFSQPLGLPRLALISEHQVVSRACMRSHPFLYGAGDMCRKL